MKFKFLGITAAAALIALHSTKAAADTDVYVGLEFGAPAPVYVERHPAYRYYTYEPAPVYYYEYREYPRTTYVYREREVHHHHRHDRGRHRGHHKHYR